ncbi:MAG: hypothetical protein FJX29_13640, partial [Alphaproteobacteria bacterium]|nr:hypothetical protein [Alphaproteobacteria bacterium]
MSNTPAAATLMQPRVSTIDLWKTAAVLMMFIDHYGHFFAPDETVWRAIGRACVPIWFFLMGFAHTRGAPWSWLIAGLALTALDYWSSPDKSDVLLNILLAFALVRFSLPWIESFLLPHRWRFIAFCIALAGIEPLAGKVLEYGAMGPLLAMTGLIHRYWLEQTRDAERSEAYILRLALPVFSLAIFAAVEHNKHGFPLWQMVLMIALFAIVSYGLLVFRPGLSHAAPVLLAPLLRFTGRRTFEI